MTTAYEKVATLITFMDRQIKENVFMASYGENEVRFYTNDLHEPKLIKRISWTNSQFHLEQTIKALREVTESI